MSEPVPIVFLDAEEMARELNITVEEAAKWLTNEANLGEFRSCLYPDVATYYEALYKAYLNSQIGQVW